MKAATLRSWSTDPQREHWPIGMRVIMMAGTGEGGPIAAWFQNPRNGDWFCVVEVEHYEGDHWEPKRLQVCHPTNLLEAR